MMSINSFAIWQMFLLLKNNDAFPINLKCEPESVLTQMAMKAG